MEVTDHQFDMKDLLEAIRLYELPFGVTHIDHLIQILYEISDDKNIEVFNIHSLYNYFDRSPMQTNMSTPMPDHPIIIFNADLEHE